MKNLIIFIAFVISANIAFAQTNDKNTSLAKKEIRKAKNEKEYQSVKDMVENKDFVLEADFLETRRGNRIPVNDGINFVSVNSDEAIIQIGSDYRIGANGVGGVTAKGKITSWKLNENKKKKVFLLRVNVMTSIGFYDLNFSIMPSGYATAELTGLSSGRLTFDGKIVPWEKSSVYEGQSL